MSFGIILPHRWLRQPTQPVGINWTHPLARLLRLAYLPGLLPINFATGTVLTGRSTPTGLLYRGERGGTYVNYADQSLDLSLTSGYTCFLRFRSDSAMSGSNKGLFGLYATGYEFGFYQYQGSNPTLFSGAFHVDSFNSLGKPTGGALSASTEYSLAVSQDATTSSWLYNNGVESTGNSVAHSRPAWESSIGSTRGSSVEPSSDALIAAIYFWTRRLTSGEHRALAEAPYQFFSPIQRRIYVGAAAGATYTKSASLDMAVQQGRTATASLGMAVRESKTATADLSVAVQEAKTAIASLQAAVAEGHTVSASVDLAVRRALSAAADFDLAVLESKLATATVDLYVQAAGVVTAALDLAVQLARTATANVDMAVQRALTASALFDLAIRVGRTASVNLDLYVQAAGEITAALDLAVQVARSAGASLDLYVISRGLVTASLDMAVLAQRTAAAALSLYVYDESAIIYASAAGSVARARRARPAQELTATRPQQVSGRRRLN